MRVPLSWLAEHVDIPVDTTVAAIDAAFVRMGLEVEQVIALGADLTGPLVVGDVTEIEELTGFKKPIRFCQVRVDDGQPRGIVCGAQNFSVGDRVAVALPGAVLPGGFAIAARPTYDHISDGMICSARELGLGDEHSGILVLAPDAPVGADAVDLLGLSDTVFDLNVTPDRGYCFSVRGIARELAHGLGVSFADPADAVTAMADGASPYDVQVLDTVGCDRFTAASVTGLEPRRPTPLWITRRLALAGIRSISLAVDVTNYVMIELGQPMHAFDQLRLSGPIVVRRALPGERLRTLDGTERPVDPEDLLISDDSGPIGLAAVMGGASTEVSLSTTDVLLEAAHWEPATVARAARRHKLPSEASKRFERGVDPAIAPVALARAVALLVEYGGATVAGGLLDVDHRKAPAAVLLDAGLPAQTAGVPYDRDTVLRHLTAIGCTVLDTDPLQVAAPSWRPDLTDPADLVEEVIRLDGYDRVPSVLPTAPAGRGLTGQQRRRRSVGRALAEAGYVEAPAYPFVSPTVHDAFGLAADDDRRRAVRLINPISDQEPELRTTLLPGLLRTLSRNLSRGQRDVALFELGTVFSAAAGGPPPALGVDRRPDPVETMALFASVPTQPWHVGAVLAGNRTPTGWWGVGRPVSWSDAVSAALAVASAAGAALTVRQGSVAPWHPGRCAELVLSDVVVGYAGELHPGVLATLELPRRVCAMELDLDALPVPDIVSAPQISAYPPALVDVALVVADDVPVAAVQAALVAGAGPLLETIRLFDVFTGDQVAAGQRSLAYALTFRAPDRTLTAEEATAARDAAVAQAASRTGARMRA